MKAVAVKEVPKDTKLRKQYRYEVDGRPLGQKRKRFKHGELEEAEAFLKEISTNFSKVAESNRKLVTENLLTEATEGAKKLAQYDATLADAVKFYIAYLEEQEGKNVTPISQVVGALRDTKEKEGCSKKYQDDLRIRLNLFEQAFENRPLSSLTSEELQVWIDSRGNKTTQANYRRILNVLFNYAKKKEIINVNPIDKVDSVKAQTAKGFLTVEETAALLHHCPAEIIPAVAIMVFAGVRPDAQNGEMSRLTWKDVQFRKKSIRLDSEITKTDSTRSVKMSDNLIAWLEPHKQVAGNIVVNYNRFKKLFKQARQDAGVYDNWIHDATRKSFTTYHVELTGNEHETMTQTGHTNVKTLRDHYKGLADKEDAEAYFSLVPDSDSRILSIRKGA